MAYDIDGVSHTVSKPPAKKTASTVAKAPPPPKVYWFQGRSYSSAAAYSAAVAAAKAAAAAAAASRARVQEIDERNAKAAAAAAEAARQLALHRAAAAARARQESERLKAQAQSRRVAQQKAELERLSAIRRQAASRELLSARSTTLAGENRAQINRVQASDRRLAEQRAATARTNAYNALARQSRVALGRASAGISNMDVPRRVAPRSTPALHRSQTMVRRAEASGDWSPILSELQSQSQRSHGRYVDTRLLREVQAKYVVPVQKVRDDMAVLVAAMQRAEREDDDEALLALVEDPANIALYERFLYLFGDGTKPGAFTPHQQILSEISAARERSWAAMMAAGGPMARTSEVDRHLRRVEAETRVRTDQLSPRGPQPIDERFTDLTFTQQVYDPDTGEMKPVVRRGVDAWLAREQAREIERTRMNQRQNNVKREALSRLLEAEDAELLGYDSKGRRVIVSNDVARQGEFIKDHMSRWQLNREGVPTRIAAAASNPGLQDQLIREFMQEASSAYDEVNAPALAGLLRGVRLDPVDVPQGTRGVNLESLRQARARRIYERSKREWLSEMARRLGRPEWTVFDEFSGTAFGVPVQGVLTGMSVIPALIRDRLQRDFGDFQPHVDIGGTGAHTRIQLGRTIDPNAAAAREALEAAGSTGDFWQDLGAWASVIRDNASWGSGNLGGLLTQAVDPLMLSGPGRFMEAGALASARAGGLRGLRTLSGLRTLGTEFVRLSAPKVAGGAGRSVVKTEIAKLRFAQKMGLSSGDALRLSDDEFRELGERAALQQQDELLKSDVFAHLTQATGIEKTQLLNMVQQELPRILDEFGIFVESPFETAARIRKVREAAMKARSEAESAAQLARAQAERATAMKALAEVTGRPLVAPKLTPARLARHEALVSGYKQAAEEFLAITQRGVRAADEIESAVASNDVRRLRTLQAQLHRATRDMQAYADEWRVNKNGRKVPARRGLVSRRFSQLQQYRGAGDPTAPSFVDSSLQQVRYDERRIKSMIRDTLRQLKATPIDQPLNAQLKARIGKLQEARRGLVYERAMLDEGRTLMRPYARKNFERIRRAVTPQRIAPVAENDSQLSIEIGRNFMRTLHDVDVRPVRKLTEKQEAALTSLRSALADPDTVRVDLDALLGSEAAALARRALGTDVTLPELWAALRMAMVDRAWRIEFGAAVRELDARVVDLAREAGFKFGRKKVEKAADAIWDLLADEHSRLGVEAKGLAGFSDLDEMVQRELVAWRHFRAEGQVRLRERRFNPPSGPEDSVFHDADAWENLVKMRALRESGVSIFAYDEYRGVLQRSMLQKKAAQGILARAVERARREDLSLLDAIKAERAETARIEVLRNVEEFATRPELQGLPPEARLRAFEEKMLLDDLPERATYQISPFQERVLRQAFEDELGFSFDEKHMIARYFRGELMELPQGARLPRSGEFMLFEEGDGIHVWVVPRDHHKLVDEVPFGRGRGELDDETMRMLTEIDEDLAKQAEEMVTEDFAEKKPWLREENPHELSEASTERRGAPAGRRQNAAAEARRSSRRNFQDGSGSKSGVVRRANRTYGFHQKAADMVPGWKANRDLWFDARGTRFAGFPGHSPTDYRLWLWDRMNDATTGAEFRAALKNLRGKNLVLESGIRAKILADAADWVWTDEATRLFSRPQAHVDLLARNSTPATRQVALLKSRMDDKLTEIRAARREAGQEFQAFVPRKWLDDVRGYVERERAKIDAYYHSTGDRRSLSDVLELLDGLSKGKIDDFEVTVTPKGVIAPASELRKLDEVLEFRAPTAAARRYGGTELSPVQGRQPLAGAPETFSSMLERKFVSGTWSGAKTPRVVQLEKELTALGRELKAAKAAARHRGRVGLSVHGDGVYIAEGTSNITVAHEMFHQFWDDDFNAAWRGDIENALELMGPELRTQLWSSVRIGEAAYDEAEMAAELFALWRVGEAAGSDVRFAWDDLRGLMSTVQDKAAFDRLGQIFGDHSPKVVDHIRQQLDFPPLGNRSRLLKWYEERGHFSPRTGEAIRSGEHVWSVEDERRFHRGFMEYEAPWTDPDALAVVLNDPRLHQAALREWGFFEDDFEQAAGANGLVPQQLADAIVWGKDGLKRQRTVSEMRNWAIQRYGSLVSSGGDRLHRMPWLMRADDEYIEWTKGFFDDGWAGAQRPALEAARDKLPAAVREHLFDGDALRATGMQIDPRLVKAAEVNKLRDAIANATRRRLERMKKVGDIEPGDWLAQEQLRFAYDVTDQLLVDPVWRGILRGKPVIGAVLHVWGQFWRMLVSWQPAFPIMNLIESYGLKRLYLTVFEGGLRPLSLDADGLRLLPGQPADVLRAIGAESDSIFHLSGGSPWARVGDQFLSVNQRGGALIQGITQLPVTISKYGEDALRTDFARRVAGNTFRSARKAGMSEENAAWLAKIEAKRLVDSFFAVGKPSGWQTALNELVPFFSYNWKNKTLAMKMLWMHPSAWVWGDRLRREVEQANREQWAKDHPDLPFPEGPSASWLWWKVGDEYYKIDLSNFSDWSRAVTSVTQSHTPMEWLTEFIRVPHPSQLGALAMFTGDDTPWGKPGSIRELSFWADLFYWTRGIDYADPRNRRDFIQIMSQMLFFKKFGKISAIDIKQSTFFALRQVDEAQARAYLEANPDLQLWWDSLPPRTRIKGFDPMTTTHFRQLLSEAQNQEYDEALEGLDALQRRLDANIARYAAEPWSDEYKAAKREAFIARKAYLNENPILTRAWGLMMTPREFARLNQKFRVDELADAWFNWKRPVRSDYEDELAYNRALVGFNERRAAFLEANPALQERLMEGRTAVETAWRQQEEHWTEVLDFQARLKIRILEEEKLGDAADRDFVDLMYRAREIAGADLDADRFAVFEGPNTGRGGFFASLPGFADFRRLRATPEQQAKMDRDQWYADGIKAIVKRSNSGKEFYELLRQNPALMAEYWARNPDKKAQYDANGEYIRWIGSWARKLQASDFDGAQAVWDTMPAWVKERYFAKHPDSKMRDGAGGGGGTAVQYNGKWFKSPESRDRYIAFIENGGSSGDFPEGFATPTFRSEESRQRFLDGQAYYASMGRWVELLKAKDYVAADRFFRALPDWMKEKYYAKHPDQRAKNELDLEALHRGAEYFLAQGDDKLKVLAKYPQLRQWLADNGGDEGAMRGLVQAMYRAIPSSEPWLKRTFRERFPEVFGEEAAGERRLESVARDLAAHPEMLPFFERALKLQSQLFMEQLKRSKVRPQPWTIERKKRAIKRGKRRAARMAAHWSLHDDIRRSR